MPVPVDFSGAFVTAGAKWRAVDPDRASPDADLLTGHRDMRPDGPEVDHERTATTMVGRVRQHGATIPAVNSITHGDDDRSAPDARICRNFVRAMQAMTNPVTAAGTEPVGSRVETITDPVLAGPDRSPEFVYA